MAGTSPYGTASTTASSSIPDEKYVKFTPPAVRAGCRQSVGRQSAEFFTAIRHVEDIGRRRKPAADRQLNYALEFPRSIFDGNEARYRADREVGLLGRRSGTAAFGCWSPPPLTSAIDPTSQKAIWPSTDDYSLPAAATWLTRRARPAIERLILSRRDQQGTWLSPHRRGGDQTSRQQVERQGNLRQCWELPADQDFLIMFNRDRSSKLPVTLQGGRRGEQCRRSTTSSGPHDTYSGLASPPGRRQDHRLRHR